MLVAILFFVAVLCLVFREWVIKKSGLPPIAIGGLPVVGHTFSMLRNRDHLYDVILEKTLGATLRQGIECATMQLGAWKVRVIMNPEDANVLLTSCLEKDDKFYRFFNPWFNGLINAEVSIWKKHRKLLNPTFNQNVLNEYLVEFNKETRQLVKMFAKEVGRGPFDQVTYLKHSSFVLVMSTVIGTTVWNHSNFREDVINISQSFNEFSDSMVERVRRFWLHNDFIFHFSTLKKRQDKLTKNIKEFVDMVIQKKIRDKTQRDLNSTEPRSGGFLDLLLEMKEEGSLTHKEVHDEVNTFLWAGSDTTAHAICIALLTLGSYPEVQRKVVQELQEVFQGSDRDVDKEDLCKLKYLEAVIKETLRLYPIIVGFGRKVDKNLKLKEYVLPAGSSCYVSVYNIGRHALWGADATLFRPERWLHTDTLPNNQNAFAVFSLGRRNCIGSKYAMMSMKTTLAHLLRHYSVSGDVTNLVRKLDIIAVPISGYHISIEKRNVD